MVQVTQSLLLLEASGVEIELVEGPHKFPRILATRPGFEHAPDAVEMIEDALERKRRFVATLNGMVVGAISFDTVDGSTVYNDWSEAPFEGQTVVFITNLGSMKPGVGTLLLKKVIEIAEQAGLKLVLATTSWSKSFYKGFGFELERGLAFLG